MRSDLTPLNTAKVYGANMFCGNEIGLGSKAEATAGYTICCKNIYFSVNPATLSRILSSDLANSITQSTEMKINILSDKFKHTNTFFHPYRLLSLAFVFQLKESHSIYNFSRMLLKWQTKPKSTRRTPTRTLRDFNLHISCQQPTVDCNYFN